MRRGAGRHLRTLSLDDRHNVGQGHLRRISNQLISASRSTRARNNPGPFELQQNLDEKPRRDTVPVRNPIHADRFTRTVVGGQFHHRQAGVFRLGRNIHWEWSRAGSGAGSS